MERCRICHFNAGDMNLTVPAVSGLTSTHLSSLNFRQRRLPAATNISGSGFGFLPHRKKHFFQRSSSAVTADFSKPFSVNAPFDSQDLELLPWIGPVPGDIAEVEAYCRIFRAAEGFHSALMEMLCDPLTGECNVSYDLPSGDSPSVEDKIVSILGCMVCLMKKGKGDVLAGRFSLIGPSPVGDVKEINDLLPPLATFRGELKTYCESLCAALDMYLVTDDERSRNVWRKLQRLMNVCYDSGHLRRDSDPSHTLLANWNRVYLPRQEDGFESSDSEVAFFTGSQVTVEGLEWLIGNGLKTIIDLRAEVVTDNFYESALKDAIVSGNVELVKLPVEVGAAPSMEQVKKFASIVSQSSNNSVYLHSKEGVWRTSAMVSRWKQYVVLLSSHFISHQMNTSSVLLEDAIITEQLSSSSFNDESTSAFEKFYMINSSSFEFPNHISLADDLVCDATTLTPDNYRIESLSYVQADVSPFESQIPSCNVFSKKDMSLFLRDKKIRSCSHFTYQQRTLGSLYDLRKSYGGKLSRSEVASTSHELKPIKYGNIDVSKTSNRLTLEPLRSSTNSVSCLPDKSNISSSQDLDELDCQVTEVKRRNNDASVDPLDDSTELNEGHMCASATGVVRLQSRKKAELFLVRTDGFSCIREQVSESSLAFTHPSTQQQMLMWKSLPKTVLLLKKLGKDLIEEAKEISSFLYHEEKMNVLVEPELHDIFASIPGFGFIQTFYSQDISNLHERIDFVACLGGDGVILHASNLFIGAVPPVVSFNLGSLGFLTAHHFENYRNDLRQLILDGVYITLRMRLRCEIFRKGEAMPGKVFDVLNEVVVERGSNPYLSKIECYEQDRLITKVQGDGVIVATPTGSTAYSTAAGGSMVHPNVPCMLFTPICPHSLSFRPVILPDSAMLELKIPDDARSNAWVSFDGKRRQQLSRGDSVRICMSQHPLPTVNKSDQTCEWFHSLIRCLNWNERLDQKAF